MWSVWHIIDKYYFFLPRYSLKFIENCAIASVPGDMPLWNKYIKLKKIPGSDAKQGWEKKGNGRESGIAKIIDSTAELKHSWDERCLIHTEGHKEQNCQCGYRGQTQVLLECKIK